jgi:hypothetical protein
LDELPVNLIHDGTKHSNGKCFEYARSPRNRRKGNGIGKSALECPYGGEPIGVIVGIIEIIEVDGYIFVSPLKSGVVRGEPAIGPERRKEEVYLEGNDTNEESIAQG